MAKTRKRPYRKRTRTLTGRRKKKGKYIVYAIAGFLLFMLISLFALNYINRGIKRNLTGDRITQQELDEAILIADKKLNEAISKSGFSSNEIIGKTVSDRSYQDLNWKFKDVKITTEKGEKIERFKNQIKSIDSDEFKYSAKNNNLNFSINLHGLSTHSINFQYITDKTNTKADTKYQTKQEVKSDTNIASVRTGVDKKDLILKTDKKSKIVIIVDDIGSNKHSIDELLGISTKLNFAVLPNLPHSEYAAEKASKKGWDVMLHLPMEPKLSSGYSGLDAGDGVLLTGLPKSDILNLLDKNLRAVPHIKGVNNHMGSKFTESSELMQIVLKELKKNNLYFVDSRTTPNSVGYMKAKEIGVKTVQRDVFLDDNNADINTIRSRLAELASISRKNGIAVGICHPYDNTIRVLTEMLPQLETTTEFASASNIVR